MKNRKFKTAVKKTIEIEVLVQGTFKDENDITLPNTPIFNIDGIYLEDKNILNELVKNGIDIEEISNEIANQLDEQEEHDRNFL